MWYDILQQEQIAIKVLESRFIKSASKITESITTESTEIAILGRSNVGKSSLINLLLNHKLAKSSSTPGKTRLINFFGTTWQILKIKEQNQIHVMQDSRLVYDSNNKVKQQDFNTKLEADTICIPLVIVDFPGFGYAKVSKTMQHLWDKNLTEFIQKRKNIKLFCHLIDSRHINLEIDQKIESFLQSLLVARKDCRILKIFTKDDKLKKNELHKLRASGNITISTLKKNPQSIQNLFREILIQSLGIDIEKF
ncbi:GTP-binding protein [Helicobacter didelphidarum]|uniref:Probable GTP-binding protein EngB n=1 Tax=Helicobacter didelphidarum TaxID=2040648 RepID=A0A3D8IQF8_9HELI|nr:GTPase [Helicobacter didelphidarum]RDU67518.1 GTP-binding protein [Helicobacter didelphidarum]